MKIKTKLTMLFLGMAILVVFVGYFSAGTSQTILEDSIGRSYAMLAKTMIREIDKNLYSQIGLLRIFLSDNEVREAVVLSNKDFDQMDNVKEYITEEDKKWINATKEEITPFMKDIIENDMSGRLIELQKILNGEHSQTVYIETFVTNKYGANIAETRKTTDYDQSDENWWQKTKEKGIFIGDVDLDESTGARAITIGLRIDDENGNFLGVMKNVLDFTRIIEIVVGSEQNDGFATNENFGFDGYKPEGYELLSYDKEVLYTTYDDVYTCPKNEIKSWDIVTQNAGNVKKIFLIAYAHSTGYERYKGLGWTLILRVDLKKIFDPVKKLEIKLLYISLMVALLAIFLGMFFSYKTYKPIINLKYVMERIRTGDLSAKIEVRSKDETNELADSFSRMIKSLKETTVSKEVVDNILSSIADNAIRINPRGNNNKGQSGIVQAFGLQRK
ncbi:MAG: HAMP domain-containing protein [Candidatus Omnitrophica bacterium]|nr:HAMP domain-containing protein [Candidatus Omnitrophota bacterium]